MNKLQLHTKKVISTVFFFISLSLYGTGIPRKSFTFIQQLNLFHNFQKDFSQKPMRIGALS